MPNYLQHIYQTTTKRGKVVAVLDAPITTQDHDADAFIVTVTDAVFSGGMAYGDFVRADGVTIPLSGTISGDTATVILAPNCYTVPGRFLLTVKVEASGSKTTYLQVDGYAKLSSTDEFAVAGDDSAPIDVILEAAERAEQVLSAVADKAPAIYENASGDMVHITDGAEDMPVQSLITHVEPVEIGEGEKSPANPWTISGWDSVTAQRTGANLLDINAIKTQYIEISGNTITVTPAVGTAVQSSNKIKDILPNAKAGMVVTLSGETDGMPRLYIYDNQYIWNFGSSLTLTTAILNSSFYLYGKSDGSAATITGLQIEVGSVATAYEPYQGKTLTADLPETLYGGTLDWTTGLVTVTEEVIAYDGTENWIVGSLAKTVRMTKPTNAASAVCCSHYIVKSMNSNYDSVNIGIYVNFHDSENTVDVETWKAFLAAQAAAGTPVTVVYELAEPYTIQLTPQQLSTLKGVNNIWSDAGATEVTYAADSKMYIDQKIAAIAAAIVNE